MRGKCLECEEYHGATSENTNTCRFIEECIEFDDEGYCTECTPGYWATDVTDDNFCSSS